MTAIFAQSTPDENLKPGWNTQGTGVGQSTSGVPGEGYAVPGAVGTPQTTQSQAGAGYPNPPGAMNVAGENSGSYGESILTNESYSVTPTTQLGQSVAWATIPATTVAKAQPFGTNALMTIVGGTVTVVDITPFGAASGTLLEVEAGETLTVPVPPAASVALTYSAAPSSVTFVSTGA